ncbi:MAG: hypothetical protein H0V17_28460 [Deltaproteobacteria bacterium]|nr:hypothetical protein [Deltaproteobacteria bacterium]
MSTGDDPPKKPPRASWEPPDPDEPPPQPRKKTTRAETKPPRASWETPDTEDSVPSGVASSVSGGWETQSGAVAEPSVVVESGASEPFVGRSSVADEQTLEEPLAYEQSGSEAYEQPGSGAYAQPGSGAYAQPTSSGTYDQPGSGAYAQPTSGAYAQPTSSGAYASGSYADAGAVSASPSPSTSGEVSSTSGEVSSTSGEVSSTSGAVRSTSGATTRARDHDDPMQPLSTSSSDNDLRESVGAKPQKQPKRKSPPPPDLDDDDDFGDQPQRKGRGKLIAIMSLVGVLGLGIGALVVLGNLNKQRFMITCEPQEVHAKQGRGFPPWGERSIDDEGDPSGPTMWKPIKIPPEAECRERETEDQEELSRWYLDILVERASSLLTAREVTKIDDAAGLLDQALLHARAPERRDHRRDIERLLGDVGYWRASAKLKDAATALTDAAKQFDAAAAQRPRHVSDANAWATYVRKLAEELRAGPNGALTAFPPMPPMPGREPARPGVALPVEPGAGSGSASEPAPVPPDAGLPTGGVLL